MGSDNKDFQFVVNQFSLPTLKEVQPILQALFRERNVHAYINICGINLIPLENGLDVIAYFSLSRASKFAEYARTTCTQVETHCDVTSILRAEKQHI